MKKKHNQYKPLFESLISLYVLNGINLILPLITIPYLLRVVGAANYGLYSFIYVIIQYALLVTNYGFDFSATKQIAQSKENSEKISSIYHAVIASRILLAVFSVLLLYVSTLFFFNPLQKKLLFLGFGIIVGEIFIPVWLFQGLEKMRFLTLTNVISKLIFTILIFVIIKSPDDFQYIILLNACGSIAAGVLSTVIVYRYLKVGFSMPNFSEIKIQFKEGFAIFGSTLGMNLYRNSNIFILGLFVSDAAVGVYAAVEKVIKAIQSIASPIAQAFFPHLSSRFSQLSIRESITVLMKVVKKVTLLLLALSVLTFVASPIIAKIIGGQELVQGIPLIRIMSMVILFGGINYFLGIVGLINFNRQKEFFMSVIIAGVFSVLFLLITVHFWGNVAAAWSMVLSEVVLFAFCVFFIRKLYQNNKIL